MAIKTWSIRRDSLLAKIALLNLIPETLGMPSSEFLWFRGKGSKVKVSLSSYMAGEIELEGKGEWPLKHSFFIDRRIFMPWVQASKEIKNKNPFVFSKHKEQLHLQHGTREVLLDTQTNIKGYGNLKHILKDKHSYIPLTDDLKAMLSCGKNCTMSDTMTPELNCVYITKGSKGIGIQAYASSDRVYYLGQGAIKNGKIITSIPFPLMLINLLTVEGLKKVYWIGKYIMLIFEHGRIWQPVSQEALESFPSKHIQKHSIKSDTLPITFAAPSRRFSKLITRLGYYLQGVKKQDWVAIVSGKKKASKIYINSTTAGAKFKEVLLTRNSIKSDFKLQWPVDTLQDVFEFLALKTKKLDITVRVDNKHGVSYIRTGNYWLAITSRKKQ